MPITPLWTVRTSQTLGLFEPQMFSNLGPNSDKTTEPASGINKTILQPAFAR